MAGRNRHPWLLAALVLWAATASAGQDAPLTALATADAARGWEAVGRLDLADGGFCTGTLVAPDLVLTAAHCLYDKHSGRPADLGAIEFRAGWRNGRAAAHRRVRRGVVHPDYAFGTDGSMARVHRDLALLQLDQPIRRPGLAPFATTGLPHKGQEVGVVSYAQDRSEAASLQELCHVLARRPGMLVLSCAVDFGASGAPVFRIEDGEPRIVSVVSAKAEIENRKVALGVPLGDALDLLRTRLAAGEGLFAGGMPPLHRFGAGGAREGGGARFVRP